MDEASARECDAVFDDDVTCQRGVVYDDASVTDGGVVADVAVNHEEDAVAEGCWFVEA